MTKNVLAGALFLAFGLIANANDSDSPESIDAAKEASTIWLSMVDEQKYQESWSEASAILKGAVTQAEWTANLNSIRGSLGAVERRDADTSEFHESLEELPDGEYFVFTFRSAFENRNFAYEVLAIAKEPDSSWRVMGYYFD